MAREITEHSSIWNFAKSVYRKMPFPTAFREKLRDITFTIFGNYIGKTKAYQYWKIERARSNFSEDAMGQYLKQLFLRDDHYIPLSRNSLEGANLPLKLIAFYLPQYHPIPENDDWWGKGFTEWNNVARAVPEFVGHYQPHLPGELGFYDLRLIDVQKRQIELAKQYGVSGFCYYHYWFGGKKLLQRPLQQVLKNPELDLPFCLCWANENWTRTWDGKENDVLIEQVYSPEDDLAFIDDLIPIFKDSRYIRVDGKPLLLVYRISKFPDPKATAQRWRDRCKRAGIEDLYLVAVKSFDVENPNTFGFDAAVEFPPHQSDKLLNPINEQLQIVNPNFKGVVYDYRQLVETFGEKAPDEYPLFKTVMPSWDNDARRRGRGNTFHYSSPVEYAKWLSKVCRTTLSKNSKTHPPLVFVNAWNEWAEGAHLEPDSLFGYGYLTATANTLRRFKKLDPAVQDVLNRSQRNFKKCSDSALIIHLYYDDLADEFAGYAKNCGDVDVFISLRSDITADAAKRVLEKFPGAYLQLYENRGRDILPFLKLFSVVAAYEYEFVCKIHSKKSLHRDDGEKLRRDLVGSLVGTEATAKSVRQAFKKDTRLGLVAPRDSFLCLDIERYNLTNRTWLDRLLPLAGAPELVGNYKCTFPRGSIYWFRTAALKKLLEMKIDEEDFEVELGQIDGTIAHSIERIINVIVEKSGYRVIEAD